MYNPFFDQFNILTSNDDVFDRWMSSLDEHEEQDWMDRMGLIQDLIDFNPAQGWLIEELMGVEDPFK